MGLYSKTGEQGGSLEITGLKRKYGYGG